MRRKGWYEIEKPLQGQLRGEKYGRIDSYKEIRQVFDEQAGLRYVTISYTQTPHGREKFTVYIEPDHIIEPGYT